ncbi:MAG: hypothetical protein ACP5N1_06095 [Candidatus Woesearchaeota archaeon]
MAEKMGLFAWIRRTSFLTFFLLWISGIFVFTFIYFFLSIILSNGLIVSGSSLNFNVIGLIDSLYASLLIATIFGIIEVSANSLYQVIVYIQLAFSGLLILILVDKLLQKYIFPHTHIHHTQDKKINTLILMMSIFRDDISKLKNSFKSKTKNNIDIKDIEAIIDGLYVTFLDIDKMFSVRNIHKHKITSSQNVIVIANIEDSLHVLSKFIDFLDTHKIEWKDKSVEFWLRYILETADKITMHFDDVKIKDPKIIIMLENIKDLTESIEKKI